MSRSTPGSVRWWQDTALITLGGVGLAVWLWDGPIFYTTWVPEISPPAVQHPPRSLAEMLDAGCLTQDHLRAMAEGRAVQVNCPPPGPVLLRDLPPEQRPFP